MTTLLAIAGQAEPEAGGAACHDCRRPYGDEHGFPDLVVDNETWRRISPSGNEGGLLCPSCLCKRAHDAGIEHAAATFRSGPFCRPEPEGMETTAEERSSWTKRADDAGRMSRDFLRLTVRPEPECPACHGTGWVCENHPDRSWGGSHIDTCECGAGMPCRLCNWETAIAGYRSDFARQAAEIASLKAKLAEAEAGKAAAVKSEREAWLDLLDALHSEGKITDSGLTAIRARGGSDA